MNDVSTQSAQVIVDNSNARRSTNLKVALYFAGLGIPVFPSSGKTPLIKAFNRLDTSLTSEEIARYTAQYVEENKDRDRRNQTPIHVGATTNLEVVKRMFRRFRDAVPSIACGPAGIVVLDADAKDDGPAKLVAKFEEHLAAINAPRITTQSGGFHAYYANDGTYTNKAGALKKDCGTDVRGMGGQTVAPGAWREDGKRYGTERDMLALGAAWKAGLPKLPSFITDMIAQGGSEGAALLSDADPIVKELMERLGAGEWPDFEVTFDADVGKYCLDCIRERAPEFGELYDAPGDDRSTNRFQMARYLVGAIPRFTVEEYASFCERWEGAGDFTSRDLAREFAKAVRSPARVLSNGSAFGAVDEEVDETAKSRRSSHVRADQLVANYQPIRWLVKRLIPLNSVGALYGLPNVGKSFVVFDLASHARRGRDWFGRKIAGGDVLYAYAEGAEGMSGRAKAWADNNDTSGGSVALMNAVPNLFSDSNAAKKLIEEAKKCEAESGQAVRLIVVDTLATATTGADGSSDRDMGLVCKRLREVAKELECAVLMVHHSGKDPVRGMRGSSALLAAVDFTLLVEESKGLSTISVQKMRDARKDQALKFKLVEVVVGIDEDGENVTSCIVRPVIAEDRADMAVNETDDDIAAMTPADGPAEKLAATLSAFRDRVEAIAADTGEKVNEIGLSRRELFKRINRDRRAAGLDEYNEITVVNRLIEKLVKSGDVIKAGDNKSTEYRLVD